MPARPASAKASASAPPDFLTPGQTDLEKVRLLMKLRQARLTCERAEKEAAAANVVDPRQSGSAGSAGEPQA
eukprot:2251434-Alexandrium_andersonii.AAC.1